MCVYIPIHVDTCASKVHFHCVCVCMCVYVYVPTYMHEDTEACNSDGYWRGQARGSQPFKAVFFLGVRNIMIINFLLQALLSLSAETHIGDAGCSTS